jgi:hypothetical protein
VSRPPATAATTIEPNECPRTEAPGDGRGELGEPVRIRLDVVGDAVERRRLTEAREVGRDDADALEERDDGLEAVMIAAVAVHDEKRFGRRVRVAVLPVRCRAAAELDRAADDRDRGEPVGVGRADGHPPSLRVPRACAGMSDASHTVGGMSQWQLPLPSGATTPSASSRVPQMGRARRARHATTSPRGWADVVGVFDLETTGIDVTLIAS